MASIINIRALAFFSVSLNLHGQFEDQLCNVLTCSHSTRVLATTIQSEYSPLSAFLLYSRPFGSVNLQCSFVATFEVRKKVIHTVKMENSWSNSNMCSHINIWRTYTLTYRGNEDHHHHRPQASRLRPNRPLNSYEERNRPALHVYVASYIRVQSGLPDASVWPAGAGCSRQPAAVILTERLLQLLLHL